MKLAVTIPTVHASFPHHFPIRTLVPGYLLLELMASSLATAGIHLTAIKEVKFIAPVFPGEDAELHLGPEVAGRSQRQITLFVAEEVRVRGRVSVVHDESGHL